jgi:glutamate synthase (NADPH/NADH) large chain
MSGGVAYVYDPTGQFEPLCNKAMVELSAVVPVDDEPADDASADGADRPRQRAPSVANNGMGDLMRFDAERIRILVEKHLLYTGSARARAILDDWDNAVTRFVKIMPVDFKRALAELKAERQATRAVAAE